MTHDDVEKTIEPHNEFDKDILKGIEEIKSGQIEPYIFDGQTIDDEELKELRLVINEAKKKIQDFASEVLKDCLNDRKIFIGCTMRIFYAMDFIFCTSL